MARDRQIVLVVDDVPENIDVLSEILSPDYIIKAAVKGEKALMVAETEPQPDLILLDIMMPGMDGYEVCERLKSNPSTKDIPVIFVTALGEMEDERKGLEYGAIDYMTKPISPSIAKARVQNHLLLKKYQDNLEDLVNQRTAELAEANESLKKEMNVRMQLEKKEKSLLQGKFSNLEQMAIGLAHEINQPLTYINTIVQSTIDKLQRNKINPEKQIVKLTKTLDQVGRIIELTYHLRALRWPGEPQNENISLPAMIDDVLLLMDDKINLKNIVVDLQIQENLPTLHGNYHKIEQVFINCLDNAMDALADKDNGKIEIQMQAENEQIVICVADNGCGMTPEVKEKIFEPFFTTKERGKAAGLGMGIIYDIVCEHHGTITCDSEPDGGSKFTITIPAQQETLNAID